MEKDTHYIGNELELFSHARNWKKYWGNFIRPYLGKNVLEAGSGIGGTTKYLLDTPGIRQWTCLEPDKELNRHARAVLKDVPGSERLIFTDNYLSEYKADELFDSILYADVIEHIENDAEELVVASSFLKPGGHLIIIVPAHQFLFSEFDKAIGHFRRYSSQSLRQIIPPDITPVHLRYLDAVGLLASVSNRLFLRQSYPGISQIKFWDSVLVPVSTFVDGIFGYRLGKSVVFIGKKNG